MGSEESLTWFECWLNQKWMNKNRAQLDEWQVDEIPG